MTLKLLDEVNLNCENEWVLGFFLQQECQQKAFGFHFEYVRSVETWGVPSWDTSRPIPKKSPRSESVGAAAAAAASVYAYAAVGLVIGR